MDCASSKAHRGNSRLSAARTVIVDAVELIDGAIPHDCRRRMEEEGDIRPLVEMRKTLSAMTAMYLKYAANMAFFDRCSCFSCQMEIEKEGLRHWSETNDQKRSREVEEKERSTCRFW